MITKRIIPCLDVKDGRVVKGVNFGNLNDVSSPVALGKFYSDCGADELVFYDITASSDGRKLFTDILREVAENVFIPLTVGGGINTIEDFDRVLKCGADKVSVNSGAIKNPDLIKQGALKYGDQCVVISADVKRVDGKFTVFAKGGRENTGLEAISWIKRCVSNGAGEVVVNSIDTDGVKKGFDIEKQHVDCGELIYNINEKEYQGGSGAGCISLVFNSYFYTLLKEKKLKRILLVATGALLSSTSSQQGESIPGIAHAVVIES
jgi:cyclase